MTASNALSLPKGIDPSSSSAISTAAVTALDSPLNLSGGIAPDDFIRHLAHQPPELLEQAKAIAAAEPVKPSFLHRMGSQLKAGLNNFMLGSPKENKNDFTLMGEIANWVARNELMLSCGLTGLVAGVSVASSAPVISQVVMAAAGALAGLLGPSAFNQIFNERRINDCEQQKVNPWSKAAKDLLDSSIASTLSVAHFAAKVAIRSFWGACKIGSWITSAIAKPV